jgi:molybdate/tungstate transport system substrate-binding protein
VALARALIIEPNLLLLDEPLSAVDPQNRHDLGQEIKRIHNKLGVTTIHVTHDFEEAISLADRIAVLGEGKLMQVGTAEQIFCCPESEFVAQFTRLNQAKREMLLSMLSLMAGSSSAWGRTIDPTLTIFHAGSLAVPFAPVEEEFEELYPQVEVQRESSGSLVAIRKVTELGRKCDIIASADYSAIPKLMFPDFADFYICFARNQMVIVYTSHSKFAQEINQDNWYEILTRKEVRFGRANPDHDPCGYRTLIVWQLAEKYYGKSGLYNQLDQACDTIAAKSVDLINRLELEALDYAFEYLSVAKQHGLRFVTLPPEIDLSRLEYQDFYAQAEIEVVGKRPGEPIIYGFTIPQNSPHPDLAAALVEFLLGPRGQEIMEENGQPPIVPAITNDLDKVPTELKGKVSVLGKLFPLAKGPGARLP